VQVGAQSRADRYTYLPFIGLGLVLAWGVPALLQGFARGALPKDIEATDSAVSFGKLGVLLGLAGVVALGACWFGARPQLGYWQDDVTLFQRTVQVTSENESALIMLGIALGQEGRTDEAAAQFREALKIKPEHSLFRPEVCVNLGKISLKQRNADHAIAMFSEAVKLKPDFMTAHFYLGLAYRANGELDKSIAQLKLAADMAPGDVDVQTRLVQAMIKSGNTEEAVKHCRDLVVARPEDSAFRFLLAAVCASLNRPDEAVTSLREAVRLAPKTVLYLDQLARLLATSSEDRLRNGPEAVSLAERACALSGHRNAAFLETLSAAYAEAGRFPEAISAAEQAHRVAQATGNQKGAAAAAWKLEMYRAGRPYHERTSAN
jgi:tetratricopeptide (TPR) repeat protein